jgi:chromosome segregation ATPase
MGRMLELLNKLQTLEDRLTTRKQQMKGLMIDVKHVEEDMEDLKGRAVQIVKAIESLKNEEQLLGNADIPTKSEPKL